ncbi:acyltransferase-domain-containing protein [Lepidopterella palustris CBS 459.81]|uniref:1-acyl-sn-glycerol-3-phosphate acyltransferase n=1 Tax=Lepidopterella palustris CBS 459.81 TaxID=1314670 RepID=A0A8E2J9G6_9PEZI|nr:acyltransferase-domain-containing protein [Lepidopterella palustris CBS 459.81]
MSWLLYTLLSPPLLITLLHTLSLLASPPMATSLAFYARLITSWLALVLCLSYGVLASIFLRIVGYLGGGLWTTGRVFKWVMWGTTGVGFRIVESSRTEGGRRGGEEALLERPAVLVGNHQTELDVLMLATIFPKYCSITAKKSLKYMPFLGWFMALNNAVFIDRGNRATSRTAFDSAAAQMRRKRQSVFIFPEGTRSYTEKPDLLPFKKGAFHLAIQAQVPVVPIVVANYSHLLNVRRRIFRAGTVDVSVLPPIPTTGLTPADVDTLTQRTRDAMMVELIRLSNLTPHSAVNGDAVTTAVSSGVDGAGRRRGGGLEEVKEVKDRL